MKDHSRPVFLGQATERRKQFCALSIQILLCGDFANLIKRNALTNALTSVHISAFVHRDLKQPRSSMLLIVKIRRRIYILSLTKPLLYIIPEKVAFIYFL
jgi:hypothetical protein